MPFDIFRTVRTLPLRSRQPSRWRSSSGSRSFFNSFNVDEKLYTLSRSMPVSNISGWLAVCSFISFVCNMVFSSSCLPNREAALVMFRGLLSKLFDRSPIPVRRTSGLVRLSVGYFAFQPVDNTSTFCGCVICETAYHNNFYVARVKRGVAFKIFVCYVLSVK